MLVLSRKIGEVVTVGSNIKITVLSFDRGIVRLGIEAPKAVPVHRKEIHDKIISINKRAAQTKVDALRKAISQSNMTSNGIENSNNINIIKSIAGEADK